MITIISNGSAAYNPYGTVTAFELTVLCFSLRDYEFLYQNNAKASIGVDTILLSLSTSFIQGRVMTLNLHKIDDSRPTAQDLG